MSRLRQWWQRLGAALRPGSWDREFRAERDAHLRLAADDFERQGLSPSEARRRAKLAFGGDDAALELQREARGLPALDSLARDLTCAWRGLRRDAGLTVAAILILAIGIGANTAVFSVVRPILLKPLPFDHADDLVWISNTGTTGVSGTAFEVDAYEGLRRRTRAFQDWTAYFPFSDFANNTLVGHGNPEHVFITQVAPRFFELLGIQPAVGRLFTDAEYKPNGPPVVLMNHGYWQRRFGSDRAVVGSSLTINGRPTLVAGVLPASFDFASVFAPGTRVDLFAPAILADMRPWGNTLAVIARLAPGVSIDRARAELDAVVPEVRQADPGVSPFGARLTPLQDHVSGAMRQPLLVLWGAVGLVLLIVAANVSNLLLARSTSRAREFALRLALGARRQRIFQQLAIEGLLLSGLGAAAGVAVACALTGWLRHGAKVAVPLLAHATVDGAALLATAGIAVATGFVFSVTPAIRLSRLQPRSALTGQTRGTTGDRRHARLRASLVVAEVAIACVLLVGAGLLGRSLLNLLDTDLGFRPQQATIMTLDLNWDRPNAMAVVADAVRRVNAIPGVTAAGVTDALPLDRNRSWSLSVPGHDYPDNRHPNAFVYLVGPGYFRAMGIALRAGRSLTETDTPDRPLVMVVSASLARLLYPDRDAVGRPVVTTDRVFTIVGVVDVVRQSRLDEPSALQMYLPVAQRAGASLDLVVRSSVSTGLLVPSVRRALAAADPGLLLTDAHPAGDLVERSVSPRRFLVSLIGAFSLFSLVLASLGVYGVVAYGVGQRTQEIGVRMALGASARNVRGDVLGGTLRLAVAGIAIGLLGAVALGRVVESLLFEVSATDGMTLAWTALLLAGVAAAAGYGPALVASRTSPAIALRNG